MNNISPLGNNLSPLGNNFGAGGGLAPQRMAPLPSLGRDSAINGASPRNTFFRKNASLSRSAEFIRAKNRYENMERIGTIGKDLQVAAFSKLKQIESLELEKLNKKNKKNDIH